MKVRFWGVRGSVAVSGPQYVATGGSTSCVELEHDGHRLILDGGTGLASLGQHLVQERSYFAVGGTTALTADVRFVAATHRPLEEHVAAGGFRQDLYYRLRVVEIALPALRQRGHGDLDRLIDHFLFQFARRHNRPGIGLRSAARARTHAHPWPGNVREVQHCLESAVVMSPGKLIEAETLPLGPTVFDDTLVAGSAPSAEAGASAGAFVCGEMSLLEMERAYLAWVLERHSGNKTKAAAALGIGRNTLLRKLTT